MQVKKQVKKPEAKKVPKPAVAKQPKAKKPAAAKSARVRGFKAADLSRAQVAELVEKFAGKHKLVVPDAEHVLKVCGINRFAALERNTDRVLDLSLEKKVVVPKVKKAVKPKGAPASAKPVKKAKAKKPKVTKEPAEPAHEPPPEKPDEELAASVAVEVDPDDEGHDMVDEDEVEDPDEDDEPDEAEEEVGS